MKHLKRIFESEQKGLTIYQLSEKGLAGKIKIDKCGHSATNWNDEDQFDQYFSGLKESLEQKEVSRRVSFLLYLLTNIMSGNIKK